MNIHEHQAKNLLNKFGVLIPKGVVIYNLNEIDEKTKILNLDNLVIKAQIHAGGRGKAGGIKVVSGRNQLFNEAKKMFGKILITPQTGPSGRKVKRLYIEEICDIDKEFYLSCLIDRSSSKIAFISSASGGIDIEEVAKENPEKIFTTKLSLTNGVQNQDIEQILKPFNLQSKSKKQASQLIKSLYKLLLQFDANLIEINPLILPVTVTIFLPGYLKHKQHTNVADLFFFFFIFFRMNFIAFGKLPCFFAHLAE